MILRRRGLSPGEPGLTYRSRLGDYRALYEINYVKQRIKITKIDKRSRAYD